MVGIVNADDILAEDDTLTKIAAAFAADTTLDATRALCENLGIYAEVFTHACAGSIAEMSPRPLSPAIVQR